MFLELRDVNFPRRIFDSVADPADDTAAGLAQVPLGQLDPALVGGCSSLALLLDIVMFLMGRWVRSHQRSISATTVAAPKARGGNGCGLIPPTTESRASSERDSLLVQNSVVLLELVRCLIIVRSP
jgi:hypothetical protein